MSTNDVPGANPVNSDTLKMGCWAESSDSSLIFVESVENGRVIYSVFDRSKQPIIEYRDAMDEKQFKRYFSKSSKGITWTWHDKTPFPWDVVIKEGAKTGGRFSSLGDMITEAQSMLETHERLTGNTLITKSAAETVADDLALQGRALTPDDIDAKAKSKLIRKLTSLTDSLKDLVSKLKD